MQPLKLTKEHKRRLLIMTKGCFPELHNLAFKKTISYYGSKEDAIGNGGFYLTGDNNIQCSYPIDNRDDSFHKHLINSTHWFEFCFTWLSHKIIFNEKNKLRACNHNHAGMLEGVMSVFYREKYGVHPVDYLWDNYRDSNY